MNRVLLRQAFLRQTSLAWTGCVVLMVMAMAVVAGFAGSTRALAQGAQNTRDTQNTFPTRPLTIVVPYNAGGSTDIVARLIANEMQRELGQPVVVENRAGATGRIGAEYVLRQPADGYTLIVMTATTAMNAAFGSPDPMDMSQRFTGAASLTATPLLLVVNPALPANNVAELIALNRSGRELNFGSSGNLGMLHLSGERFKREAGSSTMRHIPYKGSTPALNDLMGGQIDFMFEAMPSAQRLADGGKLRILGVASSARVPAAPDIPTLIEQGLAFDAESWTGLMAPAGAPDAALVRIEATVQAALARPAVQERLAAMTLYPKPMPRADISAYLSRQVQRWQEIATDAGLLP